MLYLLDANIVITASNSYYRIDAVPEFWDWLAYQADDGNVKMPLETFEEVKDGSTDDEQDPLFGWIQANKKTLLLDEEVDPKLVQQVLAKGYAPDLTDDELEQIGRDPFLIAYALAAPTDRCVVTTEVSRPTKQRQNRRVPDVSAALGVSCCDTFEMLTVLGFSTGWKAAKK
jgi:hypothetical protein